MAFCSNCGHRIVEGSKFCSECGSPVVSSTTADELNLDVEISMQVTLKGGPEESTTVEVFLTHLNKTIAIKVPNNIALGQILRLRGSGCVAADGKKGDAYVRIVKIDYDNTTTTKQESGRKTSYEGELRKCPQCGEIINAFVPVCPSCGHEMRGTSATSVVHEFSQRIEKISSTDKRESLIRNFYIPNTKEDILEFIILAASNLETDVDCADAWQAKLEQAYHKAKLSFGNTSDFEYIEKLYSKTRTKVSKQWLSSYIKKNKTTFIAALLVGTGIIMLVIGIIIMSSVSMDENWGASYGGMMLLVLGINFLIAPTWVLQELKKKEKASNKKKSGQQKGSVVVQSMGKDADDFIHEHYEDVAEQLRELGFKNIVTKAEKKGLLDTEGAVKGISIAGNAEFSDDDEFDVNSKIIIRYYSKKC